jgi:hypothetical protein
MERVIAVRNLKNGGRLVFLPLVVAGKHRWRTTNVGEGFKPSRVVIYGIMKWRTDNTNGFAGVRPGW